MKALKIKVNFATGERAGGINPRDKNLRCTPLWQNIEAGYEVRAVLDGNVEQYAGRDGVEILDGEDAINEAVNALLPDVADGYHIYNPALVATSIQSKKIKLDDIPATLSESEEAKILFERGALGIARKTKPVPPRACEICTHTKPLHKKK